MEEQRRKKHCTIIAAVAMNDVIGKDGGLPWRLPSDLARFWDTVREKSVLSGRLTYACLPKKKLREMGVDVIVLTRSLGIEKPGLRFARTVEDAVRMERRCGDLFVIGGTSAYQQAMQYARKMLITRVRAKPEGDTFFPDIDTEWDLVNTPSWEKRAGDEYATALEEWVRYV